MMVIRRTMKIARRGVQMRDLQSHRRRAEAVTARSQELAAKALESAFS